MGLLLLLKACGVNRLKHILLGVSPHSPALSKAFDLCIYKSLTARDQPHLVGCRLGGNTTAVDVERVFSRGCLVLPHVHNHLAVQSTCTLLCVGTWSLLGLVKDSDIKMSVGKDDIVGEEDDLPKNWDVITPVA